MNFCDNWLGPSSNICYYLNNLREGFMTDHRKCFMWHDTNIKFIKFGISIKKIQVWPKQSERL
jgi:hypothetical protein